MNAGLVVIKKYCNFFWKSLPKDYSVTLARFCEASSRKPEDDENIATCPNLEMGNLKILTLCMAGLVKDDALMIFGAIMKDMIDNPKLSKIFDVFKQGMCLPYSLKYSKVKILYFSELHYIEK